MGKSIDELLQQELEAARAGTHQRQKGEEKRLLALKQQKLKKAEQTRLMRVAAVDARFEEQKREVSNTRDMTHGASRLSHSQARSARACSLTPHA